MRARGRVTGLVMGWLMADPLLALKDIRAGYGDAVVLDGISFEVPEHGSLALPEGGEVVTERAGLHRATGGVVLRVEVQHQPFAAVLIEFMPGAGLVLQAEGRGGPSYLRRSGRHAACRGETHRSDAGAVQCIKRAHPRSSSMVLDH